MNCTSCGAPLAPRSLICPYCGLRNQIDLKALPRYCEEVPASGRICPDCERPLKTLVLASPAAYRFDHCPSCDGLFFAPGVLEALLDEVVENVYEADRPLLDAIQNESYRPERIVYRKCPICRNFMQRRNFGYRSGVVLDRCQQHGSWLDSGEFLHLAEWKKAGGALLQKPDPA